MKINTIGRKVVLKDNFITLAEKKLEKLEKFFSEDAVATITATVEKNHQTVEVSIKDRKLNYRSEKSAEQMNEALDNAVDTIETLIVKNKNKLAKRHKSRGYEYFDIAIEPEDDYHVEREKAFLVEALTVDEAILEMNMLGHNFYMFKDSVTNETHVVYKRKNGNYGVLIPQ